MRLNIQGRYQSGSVPAIRRGGHAPEAGPPALPSRVLPGTIPRPAVDAAPPASRGAQ
jgi:hypothetical protein